MTTDFRTWSDEVRQLDKLLSKLSGEAKQVGVQLPNEQAWFELLRYKLLPQLANEPFLIVSIVGGTNIGKSMLFNHLASQVASAVSPLAAGTRHPVCLVPAEFDNPVVLEPLFEGFHLQRWQTADDPLQENSENLLFWRVGKNVPKQLLLLDTPDIDSDVPINWQRARAIRQVADVLVAVLTQQKYNDAAVKQFFREAVQADKPIVVVINQCDLEGDRPYWPQWLATFCGETGAKPEFVYVVPRDRQAAESMQLPFYNVGLQGDQWPVEPSSLREDLASLHFDAIKIRTFRGALRQVLDNQHGAKGYLQTIRNGSAEFEAAAKSLSTTEMARVAWPNLPANVLVDEIRHWWDSDRTEWSRRVHSFYRKLGEGVTWPIRTAWKTWGAPGTDSAVATSTKEREAIVLAIGILLDELERLAQVGNQTLQPRLMALLGGESREELLRRVQKAHEELPTVDDDYRSFLHSELNAWKKANPRAVRFLQSLDHAAAIARPAITISLVVSGWVVAGDLVGNVAIQAAGHTAGNIATETAITGGIAGGGEAIVSTTSEGIRQAAGRLFSRLQSRYAQQRAKWLAEWLEQELLGDLLNELRRGAEVAKSETISQVEQSLARLEKLSRFDQSSDD